MTSKKKRSRSNRRRKPSRESTVTLSSSPSPSPSRSVSNKIENSRKKEDFEVEKIVIDSFDSYYKILMEYLNEEHWLSTETVAPLLSLQHEHCKCPFLLLEDANETLPERPYVESIFDDIILMHLAAAYYVSKKKYYTAYNLQLLIVNTFSKELLNKEKDSNWYLPLLGVFCSDLRILAKMSEETDRELDKEPYLEDVANVIMSLYRVCVSDSRPDLRATKKVAIIPMTVELFRVYFDMNKMALLKPLIRSVEILNSSFITLMSLSDLVAYNYFLGKKAIFDGDTYMQTANKALQHAFEYCPERFWISRRNILIYWLPVKMYLGLIPTPEILKEYDLQEFLPIVEGVNHGDIRQFRQGLSDHSHFFLSSGIFLMLEKLTSLTHLALFKRLHFVVKSERIKLQAYLHLLKFVGEDIDDIDEAGNIIAGLIVGGRIKGYISQSHQLVLLSKQEPFTQIVEK
uniref:CSN12-like protein n=1 Tax=Panagrolaimus superbus TaxID=310955 RepID=A0A914YVI6_9BILA